MAEGGMGESSEAGVQPPGASAGPASRTVFLSYASPDSAVANQVCEFLESQGVACWIAPRDVKPGAQYADAIVRAINEAKTLVLVLSQSSVGSSHVGREVERAASKHKKIIALKIDAALLTPALEYFLSESQWVDVPALGMPGALIKLAEAVGQGAATTMRADSALGGSAAGRASIKQAVGTASVTKHVVVVAAVVIGLGIGAVLGVRFWLSKHGESQAPVVAAVSDKSIAVLPFVDLSEKHDQEYFADGMAEEVLDLLTKLPGIRVIGRTSSFQFKGKGADLRTIGSTLGAAFVVEGSVRKSSERLRVTAQLIDANNGSHLWSETYDEDAGDVFKVQDRIAVALVRALQVSVGADGLQSQSPLKNAAAYDLYLRGRHAMDLFDKPGHESAVGYFQQSLELDPTFVRAAEWLALALEDMPELGFVPPREGYERARASVERGLALNPGSGVLHSLMAIIHAIYDWDWLAAEQEGSRALALDPRNPLVLTNVGQVYLGVGQWDEAARLFSASAAIDPLSAGTRYNLCELRIATGRLVEAEAECRKLLAVSPTFSGAHYLLGWSLLLEGRPEQALAEMRQDPAERQLGLALVYHRMGRKAESAAALAEYTKAHADDDAFEIADAHAYRGEADQAFAWLDRAYRQKDTALYTIKANPDFKSIEPDPRYGAFLKKMNLPE